MKTFKGIFDGKRPIHSGLIPIWMILCLLYTFSPLPDRLGMPLALLTIPVLLMTLEYLFGFGEWLEYRIRPKEKQREQ